MTTSNHPINWWRMNLPVGLTTLLYLEAMHSTLHVIVTPHHCRSECQKRIDCGEPVGIDNGRVYYTNTTHKAVALYTCDGCYRLAGKERRTCKLSGAWSNSPPKCVREREWLLLRSSPVMYCGTVIATFQRLALYYVCIGSSCQMIALPTQHFLEWCCIWFLVWSGIATHAEIGHRSLYPVRPLQDCRISDIFTNVTVATHSLSVEETSYQCI